MSHTPLRPKITVDEPYRRVKIALVIGLVIVGGIMIQYTKSYVDKLEKIAERSPEEALMQATFLIIPLSVVGGIPLVGMGAYFLYIGNRVRTTRRFPSPGTRVAIITEVVEGNPAQIKGIILLMLGTLAILCGLSLPVLCLWLIKGVLRY